MSTPVISLSDFKAKASQMLEELKSTGKPVVITQHGAAAAVVHDYESYQRAQEALAMLRLMVEGEADVRAGKLTAQGRLFSTLRKRLHSRNA
jgi:prevent-host-death family protein